MTYVSPLLRGETIRSPSPPPRTPLAAVVPAHTTAAALLALRVLPLRNAEPLVPRAARRRPQPLGALRRLPRGPEARREAHRMDPAPTVERQNLEDDITGKDLPNARFDSFLETDSAPSSTQHPRGGICLADAGPARDDPDRP